MKVIILAGGFGTRLGSITETIPKPMVPIGGKPIIWHIMKIYSSYGFKDFVLSLGYKQEIIKEYFHHYHIRANDFKINLGSKKVDLLNTHDEIDWNITLVDTGLNALKGARVKKIEKYLDDDINLMTYGDGVADIDLNELVKFHKAHGKILTVTGVHPPARFGEIVEKESKLISFKEKPQSSVGLINGGFFVFDKRLFNYLSADDQCDLEYETFEKLVPLGEVMVFKHLKNWECVDTERDLKHLDKLWSEGNAFWKFWK
ncbi:glucose-1-phosphate cytidylyltransferase [Candidatus Parcubacteria bacterium]|jgi:glucose-1-phosphate cytidylyltransferase|nr:MAG: glucose-1-phosphate cytidylyltransferase [Candidatus Parcubacteria bacterium]